MYNANQHILVLTLKFTIMKNKLFLFATFVLVSFGTFASTKSAENNTTYNPYYNQYGDSFTFTERGITFAVFQNGEFDFYMNPRNGVSFGIHSNNVNISFNSGYNYDAYVQYDNYGAIIQIENIPIYYDYYGRVTRIGSVNIDYSYGRLVRLGGLRVHYDHYGHYVNYSGYINRYNRHYVYHPYHNYFARPLFDFRIVSYKPYRNHYKPIRYKYYNDHSKNKYYNKHNSRYTYGKRDANNTRQRMATNNIPKRRSDNIAQVDRSTTRSNKSVYKELNNTRNNVNTIRRNTTVTRDGRNNTTKRSTAIERDNGVDKFTTTRNSTITKRAPKTVQKRSATNRRQVSDNSIRSQKSVSVKERKNTVKSSNRKMAKREKSTENTRKRRN
jgi:hypothetical protein